jgi:hypothetical protein
MQHDESCVQSGTWYYDGTIPLRVEIWRRNVRPGTGDYEGTPEIENDLVGEWYEVQYSPAGGGRMGQAGGGFYAALQEAMETVRAKTNGTIHWDQ